MIPVYEPQHNKLLTQAEEFLMPIYQDRNKFECDSKINKPSITLTYAQSLDGKIGLPITTDTSSDQTNSFKHERLYLSSHESLYMTHQLRNLHDGILVGIGTVLHDDPKLTARLVRTANLQNPTPIILDTTLRIPVTAAVLNNKNGLNPIIFCSLDVDITKLKLLRTMGCLVFQVNKKQSTGQLDLGIIMTILCQQCSIKRVMVEGGSKIIRSFLTQSDLVDLLIVTIAPVIVGNHAVPCIANSDLTSLPKFSNVSYRQFGCDMVMVATPQWSNQEI